MIKRGKDPYQQLDELSKMSAKQAAKSLGLDDWYYKEVVLPGSSTDSPPPQVPWGPESADVQRYADWEHTRPVVQDHGIGAGGQREAGSSVPNWRDARDDYVRQNPRLGPLFYEPPGGHQDHVERPYQERPYQARPGEEDDRR
jgi:hypothetical protein